MKRATNLFELVTMIQQAPDASKGLEVLKEHAHLVHQIPDWLPGVRCLYCDDMTHPQCKQCGGTGEFHGTVSQYYNTQVKPVVENARMTVRELRKQNGRYKLA